MIFIDTFIFFIIFFIVWFFYLHIYENLKTTNDLEIYEIKEIFNKEDLSKIFDLKHPTIFRETEENKNIMKQINEDILNDDFFNELNVKDKNTNTETLIQSDLLFKLMETDEIGNYYSVNNQHIFSDEGIKKMLYNYEMILKPIGVSNYSYDLFIGNINSTTLLKYDLDNRIFLRALNSPIIVKLIPPRIKNDLEIIQDYSTFDFYSTFDIFDELNIIKHLTIHLEIGDILYIPPYWLYSIKFLSRNTKVLQLKYATFFSNISIIPQLIINLLQKQNLKIII